MSEENNWSKWYKGFCEGCEKQNDVFHSAYLGIEVCALCYNESANVVGNKRVKI